MSIPQRPHTDLAHDSRARVELPQVLELLARFADSAPARKAISALEPRAELEALVLQLEEAEECQRLLSAGTIVRIDALADLPLLLTGEAPAAARALTPGELAHFRYLLEKCEALRLDFKERADLPRLRTRAARLRGPEELQRLLESSVTPEGEIARDATPELRSIRERIEEKVRWLRNWMEKHRDRLPWRGILQGNVISVRNGRHVYAIRSEYRQRVTGVVHGESSTGATLFLEPEELILHGNELEEFRAREQREVARIVAELTSKIHEHRAVLLLLFAELVELDIACAKARYAISYGCRKPRFTAERVLLLREARHPLLLARERGVAAGTGTVAGKSPMAARSAPPLAELLGAVEPLHLELNPRCYQMVITGPNTGGKTVALKTVGLLTLMSYCGIPIPAAAESTIPLFDGVFADIGDEQSIEQDLSTFSAHMSVISSILRRATSRSLVLIDELGGGTDPLEGAALGEAILESLYQRGSFALVTTHIGRLKEFAFRHRKCSNASMEFDLDRLAPLYRLTQGIPGRSNATIIARRLGLPAEVATRAEELLRDEERVDGKILEGLERTKREAERLRADTERHASEAMRHERQAQAELAEAQALKAAVDHEAERSEESRVARAVGLIRARLDSLGDPPKDKVPEYDALRAALDEAERGTSLAERRVERGKILRKGDWVFIPRYRQVLEVRKISKEKGFLTVSLNGIPAEVSFQEISWVLPPPGFEAAWYKQPEED